MSEVKYTPKNPRPSEMMRYATNPFTGQTYVVKVPTTTWDMEREDGSDEPLKNGDTATWTQTFTLT